MVLQPSNVMSPAFIGRQAVKLSVAEFVVGYYARNTAEKDTRERMESFYFFPHVMARCVLINRISNHAIFVFCVFILSIIVYNPRCLE